MCRPQVVLFAVVVGTVSNAEDPLEKEFERFISKWSKIYSAEERDSRFATFKENHAFVMTENAKGHKFTLEVNEFADMTAEEFAATRTGLKMPEKMWGDLPYLGQHKYSGAALPSSVDWSQKGAVTSIKDQGHCGSCWAFSTTGALEGAWEVATGKLVSLSEQQFVDCSSTSHGCHGGSMPNAFQWAQQNDICTEETYPYKGADGNCSASSCTTGIPKGGVTGFKNVDSQDLQAMEEAVAQQPVSVAIEADQQVFRFYKSGVLTSTCGTKLDHGVLAVGYGTLNGTDYWKVKNSWGATWGNSGYILLEKNKDSAGECGIKMHPSYPVVSGKPGPSPPPSPPAPPSPSPPSPATSHYEKPPCQSDEQDIAHIRGANGTFCAPKCDASGSCPTDVPTGTTAVPKCVLHNPAKGAYCALTCTSGGCPTGATCALIAPGGQHGVCVYPDGGLDLGVALDMIDSEENTILVV